MREHEDFLPELDFVMEVDGHIVGNIMYAKAKLKDEAGQEKEILTFGPLCIKKEYQRKGYGKELIEHSFNKAAGLGYDVVVIFGSPSNYVSSGFKSCKKFNVCLRERWTEESNFTMTVPLCKLMRRKPKNMTTLWKRRKKDLCPAKRSFIYSVTRL